MGKILETGKARRLGNRELFVDGDESGFSIAEKAAKALNRVGSVRHAQLENDGKIAGHDQGQPQMIER